MRLIDGDIILLLHALDQLLDQLLKLALHLHLLHAIAHLFVKHLAIEQCLLQRALQFVKRLLALRQFVPEIIVETAL